MSSGFSGLGIDRNNHTHTDTETKIFFKPKQLAILIYSPHRTDTDIPIYTEKSTFFISQYYFDVLSELFVGTCFALKGTRHFRFCCANKTTYLGTDERAAL